MKTWVVLLVAGAAAAAGAAEWTEAGPAPGVTRGLAPSPAGDAQVELYWDNSTCQSGLVWYTGANTWAANDFSIATLSTYSHIYSSRLYYYPNQPNNSWEGNGMAVFAFSGGSPGSMLMPSRYVRGSGAVGGWQVYAVGWSLGATQNFCFAYAQLYNYPVCDPVMTWSGLGTAGHSWYYYSGAWARWSQLGYGNLPLMIRVTVDDTHQGIAPSSFGRVKAMFR